MSSVSSFEQVADKTTICQARPVVKEYAAVIVSVHVGSSLLSATDAFQYFAEWCVETDCRGDNGGDKDQSRSV